MTTINSYNPKFELIRQFSLEELLEIMNETAVLYSFACIFFGECNFNAPPTQAPVALDSFKMWWKENQGTRATVREISPRPIRHRVFNNEFVIDDKFMDPQSFFLTAKDFRHIPKILFRQRDTMMPRFNENDDYVEGDLNVSHLKKCDEQGNCTIAWHSVKKWSTSIPYVIHPSVTPRVRAKIAECVSIFSTRTSVRWRPVNENDENFVVIQLNAFSSSDLGRVGGRQYINLNEEASKFEILHIMMHTLGIGHENSRSDAPITMTPESRAFGNMYGKHFLFPAKRDYGASTASVMYMNPVYKNTTMYYGPIERLPIYGLSVADVEKLNHLYGKRHG